MRRLPLTLIALSILGCDLRDTIKPFALDGFEKLKDAIADIDPANLAKDQLCTQYMEKGRRLAEDSWTYEWPKFAPLWTTVADPAADLAFCRGLIEDAGAQIVTKKSDSSAASAVCFQAQFPENFDGKPIEYQAAITCHEAAHIKEQERVGCKDWLVTYFSTISGRLTFEATAYALMRALFVRYGWTEEEAHAEITRRAERFPERYSIPRAIISDECTMVHWDGIYDSLVERAGL